MRSYQEHQSSIIFHTSQNIFRNTKQQKARNKCVCFKNGTTTTDEGTRGACTDRTADGALSPERLSICTWSGYVIRDDTCTLTLAPALTLPETDAFIPADWRSFSAPRFVTIRKCLNKTPPIAQFVASGDVQKNSELLLEMNSSNHLLDFCHFWKLYGDCSASRIDN
ncbi:hypothetical protein CDAR_59671 [Caerostris darwini]|uniref:Uncharacterized protein n=1 Tax=Caerostris darwini TaxID=1538125 RepID=A0AAV4X583_9ARAC|nr:hypothetical protein CDAR_59671 [Caerostris darwini]